MDELSEYGGEIVMTKNGIPVSRLVPYREKPNSLFGIDPGEIENLGDIVEPVDTVREVESGRPDHRGNRPGGPPPGDRRLYGSLAGPVNSTGYPQSIEPANILQSVHPLQPQYVAGVAGSILTMSVSPPARLSVAR